MPFPFTCTKTQTCVPALFDENNNVANVAYLQKLFLLAFGLSNKEYRAAFKNTFDTTSSPEMDFFRTFSLDNLYGLTRAPCCLDKLRVSQIQALQEFVNAETVFSKREALLTQGKNCLNQLMQDEKEKIPCLDELKIIFDDLLRQATAMYNEIFTTCMQDIFSFKKNKGKNHLLENSAKQLTSSYTLLIFIKMDLQGIGEFYQQFKQEPPNQSVESKSKNATNSKALFFQRVEKLNKHVDSLADIVTAVKKSNPELSENTISSDDYWEKMLAQRNSPASKLTH